MSDLFDDEPGDVETRRPGGRARALVITGIVLIVGFFALTTFASVYTDRLWYDEVGYGQVFSTMLWTRVGLFVAFGVLMGGVVALNMYLAYRSRPIFGLPGNDGVDRYRDAVTPIRTWLLIGVAIVVGIFAGTSAIGQWRTFMLWREGESFGKQDPYFKKDISFYVFDLPWFNFVIDFVMAVAIVALIAISVLYSSAVNWLGSDLAGFVGLGQLHFLGAVQIAILLLAGVGVGAAAGTIASRAVH